MKMTEHIGTKSLQPTSPSSTLASANTAAVSQPKETTATTCDVLTPLSSVTSRNWWDSFSAPLSFSTNTIRRRHTINPRISPRTKRRSSIRSIFSWKSGSSELAVKPVPKYYQSRFIEHLDRSEWGFDSNRAVSYPHVSANASNSAASSRNASQRELTSTALAPNTPWPLLDNVQPFYMHPSATVMQDGSTYRRRPTRVTPPQYSSATSTPEKARCVNVAQRNDRECSTVPRISAIASEGGRRLSRSFSRLKPGSKSQQTAVSTNRSSGLSRSPALRLSQPPSKRARTPFPPCHASHVSISASSIIEPSSESDSDSYSRKDEDSRLLGTDEERQLVGVKKRGSVVREWVSKKLRRLITVTEGNNRMNLLG